MIVIVGDRGEGRRPGVLGADHGDVEEAQQHAERGRLGGGGHERGDRRRGALVDVGGPLVERRDRGLEGEADDHQRQPGQHHRVAEQAAGELPGGDRVGDAREVGRAGGAVDQRQPVDQRGRADRADHQVLQPGLQRALAAVLRGAQDVQRDRQQLEAEEQRDQVLGGDEHRHPEHAEQQQRVVLAVAGAARAPALRSERSTHGDRRPRRRSCRGSARGRRSAARPEMIEAGWWKRDDRERRARPPA